MLTHSPGAERALPGVRRHPGSTRATPGSTTRRGELSPVEFALVVVLVVGLIAIALAVWLVYALPRQSAVPWDWGADEGLAQRALQAEETRDVQRGEIARLQRQLEDAHIELATVIAENSMLRSAPTPDAASVMLDRPPLALILDAPILKQRHSLSCESSAAAMAANYHGVSVDEETILNALPRHDNPHLGFRGDVDGTYGGIIDYGVYADPVRKVLASWGLQVEPFSGGIDELKSHIRQGKVVIAWVTYDLQVQSPRQVTTSDGQVVTLVPYQHAVLVTGYNQNGLWVHDPYDGVRTFYARSEFLRSFSYLGNMGLVVGPPPSQ